MDALSSPMKNNLQLSAKNAEYHWNDGVIAPIRNTDIKMVLKELRWIEENYGEITPALVVEAARDTESVLHHHFEWNNTKAADQWRVRQASRLLGAIEVKIIKEGKPLRMQAYQINRVPFAKQADTIYTKFTALTEDNQLWIKQKALGDLVRTKNKLEANGFDSAIPYIEKAIALLKKESELIQVAHTVPGKKNKKLPPAK